jgi:TPR repeat protein
VDIGYMYSHGYGVKQDMQESARWLRKAADQGDSTGQWDLGWHYACGLGVRQDMDQARMLIRSAADQGQTEAREWLSGPAGRAKWPCDLLVPKKRD